MVNSILHFAGDQTGHLQIRLQLGGHGREGRKTKGNYTYWINFSCKEKKRLSKFLHKTLKIYSSKPELDIYI